MVMGFIDTAGNYYEGMRAHKVHQEVPERPSIYHNWDGKDWIEDTVKKQADEDAAALDKAIKDELVVLATASMTEKAKPTIEQTQDALIEAELRAIAIASLKTKGEWVE
jgi:hypothetical protein